MSFIPNTQQALQLIAKGQHHQAQAIYKDLASKGAQDAEDHNCLGLVAYHLHLIGQSVNHYKKAIALNPNQPPYQNNLALALMLLNQNEEALSVLNQAFKINPNDPVTLFNLGVLHQNLQDLQTAQDWFQKAVDHKPDFANAWAGLASILDKQLKTKQAQHACEQALKTNPHHPEANSLLADIYKRENQCEEALTLLNKVLERQPHAYKILYEKGHILHKLKRYPEAFECYALANQIQDKKQVNPLDFKKENEELIAFYKSFTQTLQCDPNPNAPIYIVGSPRSGTTLLAQMLDMHPSLKSAGELRIMMDLTNQANQKLNRPANIKKIWEALWSGQHEDLVNELKNHYTQYHNSLSNKRVIDKLPSNARRLGLIAKLSPASPIIHIIRDGREVAFSAFTQNFQQYMWHSHDLKNAILEWQSTIELARNGANATKLPYLEIRYEALVEDPKQTLKTVLDFLKEDWCEACLNFNKSDTLVHTASYQQVREPIYKTSLSKAKNYPKQYEMMTESASNTLKDLGYSTS